MPWVGNPDCKSPGVDAHSDKVCYHGPEMPTGMFEYECPKTHRRVEYDAGLVAFYEEPNCPEDAVPTVPAH